MVAGTAGILIAPLVPLVPGTYTLFIVPALAAAVLGRFSAFLPAVIGGFAIGMLQSRAVYLQSQVQLVPVGSGVAELIPLILILARARRPRQAAADPRRRSSSRPSAGRRVPRRSSPGRRSATAAGGPRAARRLDGSYRAALITTLILALISLSLVVVTGYRGQISLAQMTFAGVAAFLLSHASPTIWDIPFPFAPLLAAPVADGHRRASSACRRCASAGCSSRVVTLSLAVAVEAVWFRNNDFNGGTSGSPSPTRRCSASTCGSGIGTRLPPLRSSALLCLAMLVVVALSGSPGLRTSRLGSAMLAVRANERSAAAAGISVVRIKLIGFAIGAFIAGLGGCLLAYKQSNATFESFSALLVLAVFLTAFLAGITSIAGAIVAGVISAGGIMFILVDRQIELGDWYAIVTAVSADLHGDRQPGRHRRPGPRQRSAPGGWPASARPDRTRRRTTHRRDAAEHVFDADAAPAPCGSTA